MIVDGLMLSALGMVTVVLFLSVVVLVISGMAKLFIRREARAVAKAAAKGDVPIVASALSSTKGS